MNLPPRSPGWSSGSHVTISVDHHMPKCPARACAAGYSSIFGPILGKAASDELI
jgi:hypothetical protein